MHERSLVQALLQQINRLLANQAGQRLLRVCVEVGPLSGVEPSLFATAFAEMASEKLGETVELELREVPLLGQCAGCNQTSEITGWNFLCRQCGSNQIMLTQGDSVLLHSITVAQPNQTADCAHPGD